MAATPVGRHLLAQLCMAVTLASAQFLPPLQPQPPLQPFQSWGMVPFQPMRPLPGFAPFPPMPTMGGPASASAWGGAGRAAGGGGPTSAGYASTSSSLSSAGSGGTGRAGSAPGCTVVHESSGGSQGFSSAVGGSSCSTSQRVETCRGRSATSPGHVRAVATVNDVESHCCVVLLKLPAKTPQLFCAAPSRSPSYSRLPAAGVSVELRPSCTSTTPGATGGSLACTVTFTQLPEGYTYPSGATQQQPLVMQRRTAAAAAAAASGTSAAAPPAPADGVPLGEGAAPRNAAAGSGTPPAAFLPCNNPRFKKMAQVVSRVTPGGGVVLTSKCD